MASPMGRQLYARLGFEWVGVLCVQEPGEAERLVLQAMVFRPGKGGKGGKVRGDEDEAVVV